MSLKELPVLPGHSTDRVQKAYLTELDAVTTPEQLKAFTLRWRPLYLLAKKLKYDRKGKDAKRFRITEKNYVRMIQGDYDAVEALECARLAKTSMCRHASQYSCPGMHIALPLVSVQVLQVAQHFGVTTDLALVQMNGGWGAYEAATGVTK